MQTTRDLAALVAFVDAEQRYKCNSSSYGERHGDYSAGLTGRHVREVVGEETYATLQPHIVRALSGELVVFDARIAARPGRSEWFARATYVPMVDDNSEVVGFLAHIIDVTTERRADEAFQGGEARTTESYRIFIETVPDAMVIVDETGKIAMLNNLAEELFGFARDELLGEMVEILLPETARARHPEHRAKYFAHPEVRPMGAGLELEAVRKDGGRFPVEISLSPLRIDGKSHVVVATRDLTQRKSFEAQLRQAQELEALGQIAAAVAHDFNNVLTGILWSVELVLSKPELHDSHRSALSDIRTAAESARRMTRQLLDLGRHQAFPTKLLNINVAVGHAERVLGRSARDGIEVITNLDSALGAVEAGSEQIDQILMNLTVNACDAMPTGGTLWIETANVDVQEVVAGACGSAQPGRYVRVTVADTGTGIDPEDEARIFEPFFTTKATGKGTGLGLAIVCRIVRQVGGFLLVDSAPSRGTTFEVYLPRIDSTRE